MSWQTQNISELCKFCKEAFEMVQASDSSPDSFRFEIRGNDIHVSPARLTVIDVDRTKFRSLLKQQQSPYWLWQLIPVARVIGVALERDFNVSFFRTSNHQSQTHTHTERSQ